MKQIIFTVISAVLLAGCAVKYTPAAKRTQLFDEPAVGDVTTAQVGDHLIRKGVIVEEEVVALKSMVDGVFYDIMSGVYPQLGYVEGERFYSPAGIIKSALADPFQLLSVRAKQPEQLCVVTVFSARACYDADFEITTRVASMDASFQQTLIYSGRIGDKINIAYREFSHSSARPAFSNDVEYDLSVSNQIGYKGALIEVIEADNSAITYRVIQTFR